MSYFKEIIVLTVVALALSQHAVSGTYLMKFCRVEEDRIHHAAKKGTREEVLEIADSLSRDIVSKTRRMMGKAIKAVLREEECSRSSLEFLNIMGFCKETNKLTMFYEPSRAYANKCLNPAKVNEMVKSAVGARKVDFLSEDFIKKFYLDNPEYKLTLERDDTRYILANSTYAILDAMSRDHDEVGANPREQFIDRGGWPTPALRTYMKKLLLDPCHHYHVKVQPFMLKLENAAKLYHGHSRGLIEKLSQDAKDAIFRYKFCLTAEVWGDSFDFRVASHMPDQLNLV